MVNYNPIVNQSMLRIQIIFRIIIFNFNHLNGHYLYPAYFSPMQRLKRKKRPIIWGRANITLSIKSGSWFRKEITIP